MKKLLLLIIVNCYIVAVYGQSTLPFNLYMYSPVWINPSVVGQDYNQTFTFHGHKSFSGYRYLGLLALPAYHTKHICLKFIVGLASR